MRTTLALALVLAACTTGRFDDIEDRATGDSQQQPTDGPSSSVFPFALAGIEMTQDPMGSDPVSMKFVALGIDPPLLSTFEYLRSGAIQAESLPLMERHEMGPIQMAAAGGDAGRVNGLVALTGRNGLIELYDARDGIVGPEHAETLDTGSCTGGPYAGIDSMVFGETDVDDGMGGINPAIDLVVAAGSSLILFADIDARAGGNAPACHVCSLPAGFTLNGVATIEITREGNEFNGFEFIVAAIGDGEAASFEFFPADQIRLDNGVECFSSSSLISQPLPAADSGTTMAVGNFDGSENGSLGVAFGSPDEDEIEVWFGISNLSGPDRQETISIPGSVRFGASLAAGDVDGEVGVIDDDKDELLVGDPERTAAGEDRAGTVHVFDLRQEPFRELRRLHDSTPVPSQRFGQRLTVSEFLIDEMNDESEDLVIVGAESEVFTYFAIEDATDPRR